MEIKNPVLKPYLELKAKLINKTAAVGVVGLGYVGLPLAIEIAQAGFRTIGIDSDQTKVEKINKGQSYIKDVDQEALEKVVRSGNLKSESGSDSIKKLDAVSICVPTPLNSDGQPDMSYINSAISRIETNFHRGMLIILESTTYPGTTEELIEKRFAEKGWKVGEDYFLCFSPERIDPGNRAYQTKTTPKVIGGATTECLKLGMLMYSEFINELVPVSSTKTAEMVKLLENTFRSVNIAFINEMAILCEKLKLDVWEVIDAAKTKPFGFMPFYPGPGIGGHCIPLDPMYLQWTARHNDSSSKFIELAQEMNRYMPIYTVNKVAEILNEESKALKNSKLLLLGMSYKPDTEDYRESPNVRIYQTLKSRGAKVDFYDANVSSIDLEDEQLKGIDSLSNLEIYDCMIILTCHSHLDYEHLLEFNVPIFDTRNAINADSKLIYKLGKPFPGMEEAFFI